MDDDNVNFSCQIPDYLSLIIAVKYFNVLSILISIRFGEREHVEAVCNFLIF